MFKIDTKITNNIISIRGRIYFLMHIYFTPELVDIIISHIEDNAIIESL